MMSKRIFLIVVATLLSISGFAQSKALERAKANGWEFELRAGVNLGGAIPVPMPVEIRKIEGYNPRLNGLVEAVVTKWWSDNTSWGVMTGLRLEEKGMKASARVKNYSTMVENMGQMVEGRWTGKVFTSFASTYIALPLQIAYKINNDGKVNGGFYMAYRFDGDFSGHVSEGYFRQGDPTGEKIVFEDGAKASYEFKDQLSPFEGGMQIGGSWRAYKHFLVFADMKYSFSNIFKSKSFMAYNNMHPLYMTVGFSYLF